MKKRNTITGQPLNFNAGIQKWYEKQLLKHVDELTKDVLNEIRPLYKNIFHKFFKKKCVYAKILTWRKLYIN